MAGDSDAPRALFEHAGLALARLDPVSSLQETERRLAAVFRVAPVALAVLRWSDHRYVDINEAFTDLFGWTRDEVLGKTPGELNIPVQPNEQDLAWVGARLSSSDRVAGREVRLRAKSGEELTCLAWIGLAEVDGEPCAMGCFQDISEQRAVEEALRRSEAELRAMFDLAPIGIAQADLQTKRLVFANRKMGEITGYEPRELLSMSVDDLSFPDDADRHQSDFDAVLTGERPDVQVEKRLRCKGGRLAWVKANVTVLRSAEGAPKRLFATIEDVSEQRAAQHENDLQLSALQAAAHGIVITDAAGVIQRVNVATTNLTGYSEAELVGSTFRILHSGKQSADFYRDLWSTIRAGKVWRGELLNRKKDGSLYAEDQTITPVRNSAGTITHFIAIKQDVTERKRAESALAEAEERQRLSVDAAELGTWRHEIASGRVTLDERAMKHLDVDRPEIHIDELALRYHPDDREAFQRARIEAYDSARDGRQRCERRVISRDGEIRWLAINVRVGFEGEGAARRAVSTVATSRDVTEGKRAEQRQHDTETQLRAAQKMEAVGRLAGGVAHDFNNLLSVILSYSEVALADLRQGDPIRADIGEILRAAKRAEGLTSQLLAFSRRQVWKPESVDVNALVQGTMKMLRRLIGEDIELQVVAQADLVRTRADAGQLEQVLMNLAVNSRDAMPDGGLIEISTANAEVDAERASLLQVEPGEFAEVTFSDTGSGMDGATMARIFEPFFTTKGVGKGTGLGLSTVYGIVRQSGGGILVESTPGHGTVFRIYLRKGERDVGAARKSVPTLRDSSGHETLLIVEDEEALRRVIDRALTAAGYRVLVAADALEALRICETQGPDVSLVLTDVIMPGMNGEQLVRRLQPFCPSAKVVFMSGYTDDTIDRLDVLGHDFLRKPFSRDTLVKKVRLALDAAFVT